MTKSHIFLGLKVVVTVGLLWWVLRDVDLVFAGRRLQQADPGFILLATGLMLLQSVAIVVWRWGKVLKVIDVPEPAARLANFVVISLFFNQTLPSSFGGDGMRMWLLYGTGRRPGVAFRSVLIERLAGVVPLMLLALAGMPKLLPLLGWDGRGWGVLLLIGGGLALIVVGILMVRRRSWLKTRFVRRNLAQIAFDVMRLLRRKAAFASITLVSLLGQVVVCLAIWAVAKALGVPFGMQHALIILPTILVLLMIPISIGGWGLREGAMVVGLGLVGIAHADAVMVSVTFGLLLLAVGVPGGLLWLVSRSGGVDWGTITRAPWRLRPGMSEKLD